MKKNLFLILFFILIGLPVFLFYAFPTLIPRENTENKAAENFPTLADGSFASWPKRFESWFSDNLPFKTQFIHLYRGLQNRFADDFEQSQVIRGADDWLFYRPTIENYKGLERFSDEELEQIRANLSDFFDHMEAQGSKCLFYIAPDKEQVYDAKMPARIRRVSELSRGDQVYEMLRQETDYRVIYPKAFFREIAESTPLYFSTDTHWNELGGWYAAQQIRRAFEGSEDPIHPIEYEFFEDNGKDLAGTLGLSKAIPEKNAVSLHFKDGIHAEKNGTMLNGAFQMYTSDAPKADMILIGDSFSEYYQRSAIHDVSDIAFITYGDLSILHMEDYSPTYIVLMLVERNLPFLLNRIYYFED